MNVADDIHDALSRRDQLIMQLRAELAAARAEISRLNGDVPGNG